MKSMLRERVITYIDGFNLFYGMREAHFRRYYWLDISALGSNILKQHQYLKKTKYFTARIDGPRPNRSKTKPLQHHKKRHRQSI